MTFAETTLAGHFTGPSGWMTGTAPNNQSFEAAHLELLLQIAGRAMGPSLNALGACTRCPHSFKCQRSASSSFVRQKPLLCPNYSLQPLVRPHVPRYSELEDCGNAPLLSSRAPALDTICTALARTLHDKQYPMGLTDGLYTGPSYLQDSLNPYSFSANCGCRRYRPCGLGAVPCLNAV